MGRQRMFIVLLIIVIVAIIGFRGFKAFAPSANGEGEKVTKTVFTSPREQGNMTYIPLNQDGECGSNADLIMRVVTQWEIAEFPTRELVDFEVLCSSYEHASTTDGVLIYSQPR